MLWYLAAMLACLLGMACKEVMATAPLLVLLYDRTFLSGTVAVAWRRRRLLYLGLAATWALLAFLVRSIGPIVRLSEMGSHDVSVLPYALWQPAVIMHYVRLCVWPHPLSFDYAWPANEVSRGVVAGMLGLGAFLAWMLWGLAARKPSGFLGAWFLLILMPTSSVLPLAQPVHEHRVYLSLAAVTVFAVAATYALWDRFVPRPTKLGRYAGAARWAVPALASAAAMLALGSATAVRNRVYDSELAIALDTAEKWPNSFYAHNTLALALVKAGRADEATGQYRLALQLNPHSAEVHHLLGAALAARGKTDEAIEHYREALTAVPDSPEAQNDLGGALAAAGNIQEAIAHYQEALRLKPDFAQAHNNLGLALAAAGRTDEAIDHYHRALQANPDDNAAHYNLGNVLVSVGNTDEAIEHFRQAVRLQPDRAESHHNLGTLLMAKGEMREAIDHFAQACRLNPTFALAHFQLARALSRVDRQREAVAQFDRFLQLSPDAIEGLNDLAWLLATTEPAQSSGATRAVQLAEKACQLSHQENVQCLDTLAAAYAAAGRFDDAVRTAERAIALGESSGETALAAKIRSRLGLYRTAQPCRNPPPNPGPAGINGP